MALGTPNCPSDSCSHQLDPIENWQSGVSHMLSRACMHTTSILYSQIAQKHYWEVPWYALSLHAGSASALPRRQASTMLHAWHSYADLKLPDCNLFLFVSVGAMWCLHAIARAHASALMPGARMHDLPCHAPC